MSTYIQNFSSNEDVINEYKAPADALDGAAGERPSVGAAQPHSEDGTCPELHVDRRRLLFAVSDFGSN